MNLQALAECRLFRGLSPEEIRNITCSVPCTVRHYEAGETIYRLMSKADRIGIILEGRVQAQKTIYNGNPFHFSVRRAGELIGFVAHFLKPGNILLMLWLRKRRTFWSLNGRDFLRCSGRMSG